MPMILETQVASSNIKATLNGDLAVSSDIRDGFHISFTAGSSVLYIGDAFVTST